MPDLVKTRTPRARKPPWCDACQTRTIAPGQTYRRDTYTYDGRIYDWPTCEPCEVITTLVFVWAGHPEEGVGADSYEGWAQDHQDDLTYGGVARAYLKRRGIEITEETDDV